MSDDAEILAVLNRQADFMAAGDAAGWTDASEKDAAVYGLAPPLQNTLDIKVQQDWIDRWDEPPSILYRDIRTTVSGDLAAAWGFCLLYTSPSPRD